LNSIFCEGIIFTLITAAIYYYNRYQWMS
jgi:hypothetical protein